MPDAPDLAALTSERIRVLDEEIARLTEERQRLARSLAALSGESDNLHLISTYQTDNTEGMHPVERKLHSKKTVRPGVEKLRKQCLAHGFTIRGLAQKMRDRGHPDDKKISQVYLSEAAAGVGAISLRRAELVEKLTGFKATTANWPKLASE